MREKLKNNTEREWGKGLRRNEKYRRETEKTTRAIESDMEKETRGKRGRI